MTRNGKARVQEIPLGLIRTDGGTQSRETTFPEVSKHYGEAMRDGVKFPPIDVVFDGEFYWLWDGRHRFDGAQWAELTSISASVTNGTQRDAIRFSRGANEENGMPRTLSDRRRMVRSVLRDAEWSRLDPQEIADICKVRRSFVLAIMKQEGADAGRPLWEEKPPASVSNGPVVQDVACPEHRDDCVDAVAVEPALDQSYRSPVREQRLSTEPPSALKAPVSIDRPREPDRDSFIAHLRKTCETVRVNVPVDAGRIDILTDMTAYRFTNWLSPHTLSEAIGDLILGRRFLRMLDLKFGIVFLKQQTEPSLSKHFEMAIQEGIALTKWEGEPT